MRRSAITAMAAVVLGVVLFGAQTLDVTVRLRDNAAHARSDGAFWTDGETGRATGRPDSIADLAERLSPAVVSIQVERTREAHGTGDLLEEFFGRRERPQQRPERRKFRAEGAGSGFVISKDGYILTNHHVVNGADKITVLFENGDELVATIVGKDAKTDLALVKVLPERDLAVAPLGDSSGTRVGDWLMAIGNPFGHENTVTVGILSARGRKINAGPYDDFLQTDASINPGNSGGPLIDMRGRVIGINTAINAAAQGIGFAIPINMAKQLLPQLRETGSITRGWLGVQIQRVTKPIAKRLDLDKPHGALVSQVFENSPADRAKLRPRDVIVEFNRREIEDVDDLPRRVAETPPGTDVEIVVIRDGKRKKLSAQLDVMAAERVELASHESPSLDWGFSAQDLTPEIAERLGMSQGGDGAVITDVDPLGPAQRAGLRRRDVIIEVDKSSIESLDDLADALGSAADSALLLVRRGEGTRFVLVEKD